MVAIKDMEMPKNCIECNHMDLQQAINCQLIYSGCANCGRHPNCPLVEIEERKVGEWIDGGRIDKGTFKRYKCSNCQDNVYEKEYLIKYHKYCLHCGAEMRGSENE